MYLEEIQNPEFLKSLNLNELNDLAYDIRQFLIQNIAKTGGHLASNLGVVELTIALHYVFNSPYDKVFFDVGHQCYTHKILTGRAKGFKTLRKYNGLSGFEKRCESVHDVWEAGHSSTSLSAALGMAVARDLDHKDYAIVPVIGDGALSSGMALEALNEIGSEKRNIIIIFNDNNMSISKNVGALNSGFSRLRSSKGYNNLKSGLKRSLRSNSLGEAVYSNLKAFKDTLKEAVIDGGIFEEFNLDYLGPVNGHNIRDLIQVLEVAKDHEGPIVIHVLTKKGKGYLPCEMDHEGSWHGVGPFMIDTGKQLTDVPAGYKSWSQLMSDTVAQMAEKDKDIVALTPAMIYGSSLQNFFARFPDRSFDCGIAEEHATTFAAGLAISGKRPYLEMYSSFLQRAYDQINHDICRMDLPVVIGIDRAGLVGADGETHHGVFDVGILSPLPNLILAQPKNAREAKSMLKTAFGQKHPFAIRFPKGIVKDEKGIEEIEVGTWEVLHDAPENRVLIMTYGEEVGKIEEKIKVNHLPITLVNARFFKPIDTNCIDLLAQRNMKWIVYETDMKAGGLSSSILLYANEKGLQINMKTFGISDMYVKQGTNGQLRKDIGIDLNTVMDLADQMIKESEL